MVARQISNTIKHAIRSQSSNRGNHGNIGGARELEAMVASELSAARRNSTLSLIFVPHSRSTVRANAGPPREPEQSPRAVVADVLSAALPSHLLFSHGENIVVLLADTDFDARRTSLTDFLLLFLEHKLATTKLHDVRIDVSLSIATAPADGFSLSELAHTAEGRETLARFWLKFSPSSIH